MPVVEGPRCQAWNKESNDFSRVECQAITNAQDGYIDTDNIAFFFVEENHCNQEMADDFMETVSHSDYDALTLANAMMDVQIDGVNTVNAAERLVRRALEH